MSLCERRAGDYRRGATASSPSIVARHGIALPIQSDPIPLQHDTSNRYGYHKRRCHHSGQEDPIRDQLGERPSKYHYGYGPRRHNASARRGTHCFLPGPETAGRERRSTSTHWMGRIWSKQWWCRGSPWRLSHILLRLKVMSPTAGRWPLY